MFLALLFVNCKAKKQTTSGKNYPKKVMVSTKNKPTTKALNIVNYAKTYQGTRYQYGGNTKKGMDCSGLVQVAFNRYNISVPRTTAQLANFGNWIDIKKVALGDLVFFATKKNSRKATHVGIVTAVNNGTIEFIHASTSKGVMISSLKNKYWYLAYVQARRVF